ncbi:chromate efflux transporter [Kitasatospora sp. NBC_01560]|uniref:chromate efflux transporter n=1 Tax=Kitasatospora sp. NBC_01560 TaxID=2975965 RepID=UPI003864C792
MEGEQRSAAQRVGLGTIVRAWGWIGCTGFGGPPTHIALLRRLCVERRGWISAAEFEDGIAATNLLPGPASTQLAIFTAWRLRGVPGALVGGAAFILPGLALIIGLAALFLAGSPPLWVAGAAAGAGAAVAAVAVQAARALVPASWKRAGDARAARVRWIGYFLAGAVATVLVGPWMALVLLGAGAAEAAVRTRGTRLRAQQRATWPLPLAAAVPALGGLLALAWVAFKVGALSYGGGFVIIPMMQSDAVHTYHWMTDSQFLNAVALGQITPGPVVQTVAVVGYAAAGVPGALLAAAVAFAPSFLFVLLGAHRFDRLRADAGVQAFFTGAGPAVIGAITGSAVPLALALQHAWQYGVLALAALWLLAARKGVVGSLLGAGALGVAASLIGWPVG